MKTNIVKTSYIVRNIIKIFWDVQKTLNNNIKLLRPFMHSSNSPITSPHISSTLPVTRRPIISIPPSGPDLHLSESGVLTRIDTRPTPTTFTVVNIPLHHKETFAIGDIIVF